MRLYSGEYTLSSEKYTIPAISQTRPPVSSGQCGVIFEILCYCIRKENSLYYEERENPAFKPLCAEAG